MLFHDERRCFLSCTQAYFAKVLGLMVCAGDCCTPPTLIPTKLALVIETKDIISDATCFVAQLTGTAKASIPARVGLRRLAVGRAVARRTAAAAVLLRNVMQAPPNGA